MNHHSFNAAISSCMKELQCQHLAPLCDEMHTEGLSMDLIGVSSAISACDQGGEQQHLEVCTMPGFNSANSACEKG
eukprot:9078915-Karenia_brevis.AAC.1